MNLKMTLSKYLFIVFALTTSCNTTASKDDKDNLDSTIHRHHIDILKNENEKFSFIKYKQDKLQLDSIQNGFDSFQVRLWIIGGLYGSIDLYVLKNADFKWSAHNYFLNIDSNYANGIDQSKYRSGDEPFFINRHKLLKPNIPWNRIVDSLNSFGLMTLPDMDQIPGMNVNWTDAGSIVVEVATTHFYRVYHYSDPWSFSEKFDEANKIMSIISVIQTTLK